MVPRRAAVAEALRQRLFTGLHLGVLREGERLPAVRDLARELGVNARVVLAAYEQLQREGLVELRPRSGAYVACGG
jgi:DNA-binding transcriptional regulator YhcF (GntR family)